MVLIYITLHFYFRGAISETRESYFGVGNWNSTDILMDDVACSGSEREIHRCNYVYPSNCGASEGAGVVCEPHSGNDSKKNE